MTPTPKETDISKATERCCQMLYKRFQRWQCFRKSTVVRDGRHYCTIHDPIKVAQRQKASRETFEAGYKRQQEELAKVQLAIHLQPHYEAVAKAAEAVITSESAVKESNNFPHRAALMQNKKILNDALAALNNVRKK